MPEKEDILFEFGLSLETNVMQAFNNSVNILSRLTPEERKAVLKQVNTLREQVLSLVRTQSEQTKL